MASTTIGVTLGQVENDVLITWNRTSSQCVDNGESFKTHPLSNSTMYMIPALEEYTEYNITVCINDSTCAFSIVTTNQAGMFGLHSFCLFNDSRFFQLHLQLQKKSN